MSLELFLGNQWRDRGASEQPWRVLGNPNLVCALWMVLENTSTKVNLTRYIWQIYMHKQVCTPEPKIVTRHPYYKLLREYSVSHKKNQLGEIRWTTLYHWLFLSMDNKGNKRLWRPPQDQNNSSSVSPLHPFPLKNTLAANFIPYLGPNPLSCNWHEAPQSQSLTGVQVVVLERNRGHRYSTLQCGVRMCSTSSRINKYHPERMSLIPLENTFTGNTVEVAAVLSTV